MKKKNEIRTSLLFFVRFFIKWIAIYISSRIYSKKNKYIKKIKKCIFAFIIRNFIIRNFISLLYNQIKDKAMRKMYIHSMTHLFTERINSMKKIVCTLLLALATTFSHAQTYTGNLTLSSQTEIDDFNFTEVTGDLTINDTDDGNITNLIGLRELTQIGGFLNVGNNISLTSLNGLVNLIQIGGELRIQTNGSLVSLSGLESLKTVGGLFLIRSNPQLTSLTALTSLTTLGERLFIDDNDMLVSLNGLESITTINSTLQIVNNNSLVDFCAISALVGDGNQITSGEYTVNTNGHNPIYSIIGNENFCSNTVGGIFVGNLTLNNQDSIDAFRYRSITGNLIIDESVANDITNLDGLNELTNIGGELRIQTNGSLVSLSGLEALETIGGVFLIRSNPQLASLTALTSLTTLGERLFIDDNDVLASLNGLESITTIRSTLNIINNNSLVDFCSISSLVGTGNQITSGEYTVNTNSYNPSYSIIVNENFCSNAAGEIFTGDLTLDNQDSIDAFSYRLIAGNLIIDESVANDITNLDGLSELTNIGGELRIINNNSLVDFCAISSLIGDGNQITSGEYTVNTNSYNPSYATIQTPTACFIPETILTSQAAINGFMATEVTGNLVIEEATPGDITNLNALSTLTTIGNDLRIRNNTALTSLSGLEMLDSIGGRLNITGNTALTDFCVTSSLVGDANQITMGEYTVTTNSYNPTYNFIQRECSNADGRIFDGHLTLDNQDSIDAFSATYTIITGNLTINDIVDGNITNLDSLRGLTQIEGNLVISSNTSLTSLSGLEDLTQIEGALFIGVNDSLSSLSGLDALTTIGGNIDIDSNPSLTSLRGLNTLTTINGILEITSNASLTSLSGLEMLNSIGGRLSIRGNTRLTDFCSISSLIGDTNQITDGEYTVNLNRHNPSYATIQTPTACSITETILTSQAAINAFMATEVTGNLVIEEATAGDITNLNALSTLTTIGNNLHIRNNTSLTSLSGLEMLDSIGSRLIITGNPTLTDFCLLSYLVGDANQITREEYSVNTNGYNPRYIFIQNGTLCSPSAGIFDGNISLNSQASIDTFNTTYTAITGSLFINDVINNNITNLDGLSSLTDIGGTLSISANSSLTSLSGLSSLTDIGGTLTIQFNGSLTSLSGLSSLTDIGFLNIQFNSSLLSLSALNSLTDKDL